jgi:hypothetical protein
MGIMDHRLPTLTPLQVMGIGILIMDSGTIPATGTVVIMDPDIMVTMAISSKEDTLLG